MRVSVVGAGYVGLVTAACLAALGHEVICVDAVQGRVDPINEGRSPIYEPGLDDLVSQGRRNGKLSATTDTASAVAVTDITIIAVGTPTSDGAIDLRQVATASRAIGEGIRNKDSHTVVTKSTVVPGTNEDVIEPAVRQGAGHDRFVVAMNPEFLRQGMAVDDFMQPDRIVIGARTECTSRAVLALYEALDAPTVLTSLRNAELIKYASNALLATLISFSNEIANICEDTPDADVATVLEGVYLDRRIATRHGGEVVMPGLIHYLAAGGGFGGSCLPKDVQALSRYAEDVGARPSLLNAVLAVNADRAARVIRLVSETIGGLSGQRIAVLGLAFKGGTDDCRESPALRIVEGLCDQGANVVAWDPLVGAASDGILSKIERADSPQAAMEGSSCAVVASSCPELLDLDWNEATRTMKRPTVVDTRGFLDARTVAKIEYLSLGVFRGDRNSAAGS